MDLFDLVATLTLDTSEYEKGLTDSETKGKGFGSGLAMAAKGVGVAVAAVTTATAAAGGAFLKGAGEAAKAGDEIDKMSQKVGLSAEAYQKWDYVMKISGTEMSNMRTGLKTLTNKIDDAKNGSSKAQEMFEKLGISMEDLNNMSREDAFAAAIKGFQGMADSTERAALANDLFGRSGQELTPLFNTSAEETQKLMDSMEELGGFMSDDAVKAAAAYEDALTTFNTAVDGTKRNLLSGFLPAITTVMDGLTDMLGGKGTAKIEEGLTSFVEKMSEAIPKVFDMGGKIVSALGKAIIQNLPMLLQAGTQTILQIATGLSNALPTLIPAMVEAVLTMVDGLLNNINLLVDAALQLIVGLAEGLIKALPVIVKKAPIIIKALVNALLSSGKQLLNTGINVITNFGNGLIKGFASIPSKVTSLAKKIPTAIKNGLGSLVSVGANLIEGLWDGIKAKFNAVIDRVKAMAASLPKAVKKVLGISSPSKVFMELGKWIPEGLAIGIEKNLGSVYGAADDMANATLFEPADSEFGYGGEMATNSYVFNVYASPNQSAREIAEEVKRLIIKDENRRRVAWV